MQWSWRVSTKSSGGGLSFIDDALITILRSSSWCEWHLRDIGLGPRKLLSIISLWFKDDQLTLDVSDSKQM